MTVKDNSTIAITDILTFLKRHTKHIIIFGFLTAFIVATISFLMQPIYRSTATVLIDGRQSNVLDAASIMSGITSDSAVVDSQTEIIKSPVLLDRVANKEKLRNVDYFYTPSQSFLTFSGVFLGIHQPYSENSEPKTQDDVTTENETINETTQAITTAETQDNTLKTESLVMNWLKLVFPEPAPKTEEAIQKRIISKLQDNLSVTRIGKSLVLSISVETTSPSLSKRIVNRITNEYLNDQLETKLQATKRATSWLTERLSDLRTELDSKETAISAFKQANNLFGASGVTQIEQQVSRLNEQLIAAKVETAEKRARYNQVQSLARTGSLQSYSGFVSSGTVSNLRLKESEAVGDVANLSAKYGGNHPQLINAQAKLRDIRKQINQEAGRMVANARSEYNIAQSRESSLRASLNGLKGQFDRTGAKSIQLQKLEREAEAARTAYNAISERFRETDNSDKIQESDARIISLGSAPLDPVKPKKGLLTVVGFILGCLIGTVIAVIRDALIKGFLTADQLQDITQKTVLSSVMHLQPKDLKIDGEKLDINQYILRKPLSAFAESIRRIRVGVEAAENLRKLSSSINKANNNIVMITSSVPSEGKTTISSSYALSASQSGKKVILIDADFRRPALTKAFVKDIKIGLTEYLEGDYSPQDAIMQTDYNNLDFIGINQCPSHPTDLLKNQKCADLFQYLSAHYDLVLIDTPPLAAVIDGRVIAEFINDIIYVTAWQDTPRKVVTEALNVLPAPLKEKVVGLVLNKIDLKKESKYGYEYGYGYGLKKYASYYNV